MREKMRVQRAEFNHIGVPSLQTCTNACINACTCFINAHARTQCIYVSRNIQRNVSQQWQWELLSVSPAFDFKDLKCVLKYTLSK